MRRALGISGAALLLCVGACSPGPTPRSAPPPTPPTAVPAGQQAVLPPPEALADVMYRLADPGIPGADKLALVAGAAATDSVSLDSFATALRDGGYTPVTVTAADVGWSDTRPGDVRATITITGPNPEQAGDFRFPLEFRPHDGGWQLTRDTADMLLVFGP